MLAELATDTIVGAGARQQGVDFLGGGLGAAGPKFQDPAQPRRKFVTPKYLLDCLAIEPRSRASLRLQPLINLRDLVDPVDRTTGEFGRSASIWGRPFAILRAASANF